MSKMQEYQILKEEDRYMFEVNLDRFISEGWIISSTSILTSNSFNGMETRSSAILIRNKEG